jgi:hypothetical protein
MEQIIEACVLALVVGIICAAIGYMNGIEEGGKQSGSLKDRLASTETDRLLVKGEKIGFEKGMEAGRAEATEDLKEKFVVFLEDQIKVLRNQPDAPE